MIVDVHGVGYVVHCSTTTLQSLPLEETYLPPAGSPLARARPLMQGFHKWNVKKTYQELTAR